MDSADSGSFWPWVFALVVLAMTAGIFAASVL